MKMLVFLAIVAILGGQQAVSQVEDIKKLSYANNIFSLALHRSFDTDKNVFFSPASVFTALGMLYKGARGTTADQMKEVLGFDENVHESFKNLLNFLRNTPDEYKLEIANAVVSQSDSVVLEEFKNTLINNYNALYKEVDFAKESANAVQEINNFVNEKTHGKIEKLLDKLDPLTRMVLLNAVYFKGLWKTPFNVNDTREITFYNNGKDEVKVPMMHVEGKFSYRGFSDKRVKILELPYKGKDVSMFVLLPYEKDGLKDVEKYLTVTQLEDMISNLVEIKVSVSLPKFKLEDSRKLKKNLRSLGIQDAFEETAADLSGINGGNDLYVSEVVHKAVIECNEEGSEAAAVTGVIINTRIGSPSFYCNHPFLFIIRDNRSGLNLFVGRVNQL